MLTMQNLLLRFLRDDRGGQAIEFIVVFPAMMFFFFAYGEAGTLATRAVMLERGLDIAIRDIRTVGFPADIDPNVAHDFIKQNVCANAFLISTSCNQDLLLEMVVVPAGGTFPNEAAVQCQDRALTDPAPVTIGGLDNDAANSEIVLVRACLPVRPIFAFLSTTGYALVGGGQNYDVQTGIGRSERIEVAAGDGRVETLSERLVASSRSTGVRVGSYAIQAQSAFLNEPPD